jgi:F-type H+-transporting ATPase subunit delta
MDALSAVVESFEVLLDERLGFSRANITSARELDQVQRADLEAQLTKLTGRRMRLKFTTDESLIGGLIARIGSTVYDGSLKGRLAALGRQLAE